LLIQEISVVRGLFHGFDYQDFETEALELMPYAADHILEQMDGKNRLSQHVGNLTKQFALCCTLDEAMKYREEIAFFQAIKAYISKPGETQKQISNEKREHALRQIVSRAVVSDEVLDIFDTVGLKKPNIGILSEEFLDEVRLMPQKNLAVELLERLLKMEIKTRFSENVVQNKKFSDLLKQSLNRYHNRAIETVQVIEELLKMAKEFNAVASRGEQLGLTDDEVAFYDALETNEASVRDLGDDTLKKIAVELTENLRKNTTIDWAVRETVRARLRLMVKRILRKYKYPPDQEKRAIEIVLEQAETLSESWI
jgi:type I restriction enzyme R subunit